MFVGHGGGGGFKIAQGGEHWSCISSCVVPSTNISFAIKKVVSSGGLLTDAGGLPHTTAVASPCCRGHCLCAIETFCLAGNGVLCKKTTKVVERISGIYW